MLTCYRRRLPHWRLEEATYFVTWRLRKDQPELSDQEKDLIVSAITYWDGGRYELIAYVVMNDHIHALLRPIGKSNLKAILHSWKSYTANRMQRESDRMGAVWQDEYFDRIVRNKKEYLEKAQYILNNPQKKWPEMEEYHWVLLKEMKDGS